MSYKNYILLGYLLTNQLVKQTGRKGMDPKYTIKLDINLINQEKTSQMVDVSYRHGILLVLGIQGTPHGASE